MGIPEDGSKEAKCLVGIFDSGVGGLSVLKRVRDRTPADILYFGDCARAPYGNRDKTEISSFIKEIILHLKERGVTHFVSACNSMSVHMAGKILEETGTSRERYINMVDAMRRISFSKDANILVLGTAATISSGIYQDILNEKGLKVCTFVPASLAGEIERGDAEAAKTSIRLSVEKALVSQSTDIIYACTHYPLLHDLFEEEARRIGWTGKFVDPAEYVAEAVAEWNLAGGRNISFETSRETPVFSRLSEEIC